MNPPTGSISPVRDDTQIRVASLAANKLQDIQRTHALIIPIPLHLAHIARALAAIKAALAALFADETTAQCRQTIDTVSFMNALAFAAL